MKRNDVIKKLNLIEMDGGNAFQKLIFGKLILVYFDNQKKYWENLLIWQKKFLTQLKYWIKT